MAERAVGFTLIEAMVAMSLLAGGLILVQQIHGAAARVEHAARERDAALGLAEAQVARAYAAPLGVDESDGVTPQGLAWRRSVRPAATYADDRIATLWLIEVAVTAPGGRRVTLRTLRRGKAVEIAR